MHRQQKRFNLTSVEKICAVGCFNNSTVSRMSGCLDKIDCRCDCDCLDAVKEWLRPKRNMFASIVAGCLFALGWWAVIDAFAEHIEPVYGAYFICGFFSTVALLMINAVSTGQVTGDTYTEGCVGKKGARAWLFVGFVLAFGGLIGSLWIFIQQFLVPAVTGSSVCPVPPTLPPDNSTATTTTLPVTTDAITSNSTTVAPILVPCPAYWWQGVSVFAQNILIFLSTLVFKFGRTEEESW